ncbi:MAG TPA: (4Fe-4S)-binding protein, partial [Desulfurivibrionaceae bacterium]|nr:(4Fe-4S)-binding protein [Desulfurivibrionaceae bacterium]
LVAGFLFILAIIRSGSRLFGITEDPTFGRFSPLVPILIPMAFSGELVYRMGYFARGVGDFLPTAGRQAGVALLERLSFAIPNFPVQVLSAFFLLNGSLAGCYILWQFCLREFEGLVPFKNFLGINLLIGALLVSYLMVIF